MQGEDGLIQAGDASRGTWLATGRCWTDCRPELFAEAHPRWMNRKKMAIRLYFRLSEDEADLRAQGWVSDDTWRDWSGAISSQMRRPPFDRIWAETCEDSAAGRDYEFRHLRQLWDDASYDPAPTGTFRRRLRRTPWRRPRPTAPHRSPL